jgi:hypothetical protein
VRGADDLDRRDVLHRFLIPRVSGLRTVGSLAEGYFG